MSKKLSMSELIILHNELADKLGVSQETSFKSLAAARAAILVLETKLEKLMNENPTDAAVPSEVQTETAEAETEVLEVPADADAAPETPAEAADNSKYNSSGKRGPNQGVGAFAKALIAKGQDNATVLAAVKEQFPDAKTTTGCIAFYRNALAKGPVAKSSAVLREKAAALIAEANAIDAKTAADAADAKTAADAADAKAAEIAAAEVAEPGIATAEEAPM